jgi:hypothetical protein
MKWTTFLPLAALVILTAACERHPASELEGEHGAKAHGSEHTHASDAHTGSPTAPAPGLPHQPGGANPVAPMDEHSKAMKSDAAEASAPPASPKTSQEQGHGSEASPSFFGGKK